MGAQRAVWTGELESEKRNDEPSQARRVTKINNGSEVITSAAPCGEHKPQLYLSAVDLVDELCFRAWRLTIFLFNFANYDAWHSATR